MIAKPVVVITGVAGGIGAATAGVFSKAGWQVVGVDRVDRSVSSVDHFIHVDIADEAANRSVFDKVTKTEGRLDALVNNAAMQIVKDLVDTLPDEWDAVQASNVRAVYLAIRHAYPLLKANGGGSIVNVSSVHAVATSTGLAAYVASKGALMALTRAAALELARDNIIVNAVLPGAVDTHMLRAGLARDHAGGGTIEERMAVLGRKHVVGRVGQPEEIGEIIHFLCQREKASFLTGQSIVIDGGATARLSTE